MADDLHDITKQYIQRYLKYVYGIDVPLDRFNQVVEELFPDCEYEIPNVVLLNAPKGR
jgi:hypothetical protein